MKTTQKEEQAIRELMSDVVSAFNRLDVEKLLAMHTDDIILMAPNMPIIHGKQMVRELFADFVRRGIALKLSFTLDEVEVSGGMAYVRGKVYKTTIENGGITDEDTGKFICLLKKQDDGRWLRTHVIVNSDSPVNVQYEKPMPARVLMGVRDRLWSN